MVEDGVVVRKEWKKRTQERTALGTRACCHEKEGAG